MVVRRTKTISLLPVRNQFVFGRTTGKQERKAATSKQAKQAKQSEVHYKRGYSGAGHAGGVCSSVAYVMSGGSLNSQMFATICAKKCVYMSIKRNYF